MDDIRSKQRKPDDSRHIGIVFADGSGKFVNIGKLALAILVLSVVFASVGAGGIPGGSVFLLFMVLSNLGLDEAQTATIVALAIGINPLLDMFETACNVTGDNVCTYIVGKKNNMLTK